MRYKWIRVAIAALLALTMTATAAYAAGSDEIQDEIDSLNGQKSDLQDRMDDVQEQIDSLEYENATILTKKQILDEKNELAAQELEVIGEQIAIVDGMLQTVQGDLDQAREEEQQQLSLWEGRVRTMEESGQVSYLQVLFESTSFSDLLTRLDMINEVMDYDQQLEEQYVAAREKVEQLEGRAEELYADNESRKAELEDKQAQLQADIDAACQLVSVIGRNKDKYEEMLREDAATVAQVEALIAQKRDELAAAQAAEGSASPGSVTGAGFIWPSYTHWHTSYYGPRYLELYGYWRPHNGVDIGATWGSQIWAAAGGTVILAGRNGGYGNCVMVMHSNGYTTLYGHMSSIAVTNGQTVSQGQVLGYVGSTGNSTGPHLHFEIRSNANPSVTYDPDAFVYYG